MLDPREGRLGRALRTLFMTLAGGVLGGSLLSGCAIARPFEGPGYDDDRGVTADGAGDTVTVVLTHAVVYPDRRGPFDDYTRKVAASIERSPGLVGFSMRREILGDEAWTMSIWTSPEAVEAFVRSDLHLDAMEAASDAIRRTRFRQFELPASAVPLSWDDALARFEGEPARARSPGYGRPAAAAPATSGASGTRR